MPQLLISEDELMATQSRVEQVITRPDFNVRPLDEYSSDELMILLLAVADSYERAKKDCGIHIMHKLDLWAYRIKDAAKEASKREREL